MAMEHEEMARGIDDLAQAFESISKKCARPRPREAAVADHSIRSRRAGVTRDSPLPLVLDGEPEGGDPHHSPGQCGAQEHQMVNGRSGERQEKAVSEAKTAPAQAGEHGQKRL